MLYLEQNANTHIFDFVFSKKANKWKSFGPLRLFFIIFSQLFFELLGQKQNKTITEYNNIHMWNVNMRNGLSCKTFQNIISAMHVRASSMRCACVCVSNNAQFNHHTQQQKQIDEKDEKRQTIRRCSLNSMRGTSICSSPICEYATRWVGTSSIRRTEWRKSSFHYTHICKGKAFNYETERSRKSAMEKTKYEKKDSSLFLFFY